MKKLILVLIAFAYTQLVNSKFNFTNFSQFDFTTFLLLFTLIIVCLNNQKAELFF